MENLEQKYAIELDSIKGAIQSSDLLQQYLEDEEEETYQSLRLAFEPQIEAVYEKVAAENPLQLVSFEEKLLEEEFEGLYLSRILGYAVLRGEFDENYRYKRPQDHFKNVLLAIGNSSNFDLISKRIGQGVQIGFGLSSNIWITNLIDQVDFKRVKTFLRSQVLEKYRDPVQRRIAYNKYGRQFQSVNYFSAEFPQTVGELKVLFSSLRQFLLKRIELKLNNIALIPHISTFLDNKEFQGSEEYVQMLHLVVNFMDTSSSEAVISARFNEERVSYEQFNDQYFAFHEQILASDLHVGAEEDARVFALLDKTIDDDLTKYYNLMNIIHTKGYVHDDTIEAVRTFYDGHEGLSTINECLRDAILNHFNQLLNNLSPESYQDYFAMNKIFAVYIQIFNNQQFNQDVKKASLNYIAKLLKMYTDKRGRDYQDIKKFVMQTFIDLGFLKEKQLVELFKTRRKKKKPA